MNNRIDNKYDDILKNTNSPTSINNIISSKTNEFNERLAYFRKKYKLDKDTHSSTPKMDTSPLNIFNNNNYINNNNSSTLKKSTERKFSSSKSLDLIDLNDNTSSLYNDENNENQIYYDSLNLPKTTPTNSDRIKTHNIIHNHLKIPSFNNEKLTPSKKSPSTSSSLKSVKNKSNNSVNSFNPINSSESSHIKNPFKKNSIFNNNMESYKAHSSILFKNRIKRQTPNNGIKGSLNIYSDNDDTIYLKPSTIILSKKNNLYPTKYITKKIFKYNNQRKSFVKIKMVR